MRAFFLFAGGLMALAAIALTSGAQLADTGGYNGNFRSLPPGPNQAIGYFTWNGGAGGIAWDATAPSAVVGGKALDGTTAARTTVGWNMRGTLGTSKVAGQDLLPMDEFRSDPVPKGFLMNVSKPIQIDLYKTQCTGVFNAEVWMGDRFLAGWIPGQGVSGGGGVAGPYQFVPMSMHPETDTVVAGSVITIKLYYYNNAETRPCEYSLADPQRTAIRFPLYAPEELAFRLGQFATGGSQESQGSGVDASEAAAGLVLFLVAAAPGTLRRRGRGAAMALVLVLVALSGCVESSGQTHDVGRPGGPTGKGNVTIVDDSDGSGELTTNSTGAIQGTVTDEFHRPIPGVFVALLGTSKSLSTPTTGRFDFLNLSVAKYGLRFDKTGWVSLELDVEVLAGKITKVQAIMVPPGDPKGDLKPHKHDLWTAPVQRIVDVSGPWRDGESTRTFCGNDLFDFVFYVTVFTVESHCLHRVPFPYEPKNPVLILPGARQVDVTISWDASQNPNLERVGVRFMSNLDSTATFMYPKGNGKTTTIATNWEMTDVGHQSFTTWTMDLFIPTNGGGGGISGPRMSAQLTRGDFKVTIDIHKGVVPLEPGHMEFWGQNQTLPIPVKFNGRYGYPATLIPPGTKWLEAKMELGAEDPREFTLGYRGADMPPWVYYDEFKLMTVKERTPLVVTYAHPIQDEEADGFYAPKSNWIFNKFLVTKQDSVGQGEEAIGVTVRNFPSMTLTLVAHRDALTS